MKRRSFLVWSAATGVVGLGSFAGFNRWQEIDTTVKYPGRAEGHFLRDHKNLPAPSEVIETDVVILGSGIAGLTAAWKLNKEAKHDFLMIDGPQLYGNAAGGHFGDFGFHRGADCDHL